MARSRDLLANQRPVHRSFLRAPSLNGPSKHPRQKYGHIYDEYYININSWTCTCREKKLQIKKMALPLEYCTDCTHFVSALNQYLSLEVIKISTCCRSGCAGLLFWFHVASQPPQGGHCLLSSARLSSALPCAVSGSLFPSPVKGPYCPQQPRQLVNHLFDARGAALSQCPHCRERSSDF